MKNNGSSQMMEKVMKLTQLSPALTLSRTVQVPKLAPLSFWLLSSMIPRQRNVVVSSAGSSTHAQESWENLPSSRLARTGLVRLAVADGGAGGCCGDGVGWKMIAASGGWRETKGTHAQLLPLFLRAHGQKQERFSSRVFFFFFSRCKVRLPLCLSGRWFRCEVEW